MKQRITHGALAQHLNINIRHVRKLVRAGILRSAKGRGGGFAFARPIHEITLMHIVEAVEGPQMFDRCVVGLAMCNDAMPCPQHDLYKPIRQRLKDYLATTTVADLAASLKAKQSWHEMRNGVAIAVGTAGAKAAK